MRLVELTPEKSEPWSGDEMNMPSQPSPPTPNPERSQSVLHRRSLNEEPTALATPRELGSKMAFTSAAVARVLGVARPAGGSIREGGVTRP